MVSVSGLQPGHLPSPMVKRAYSPFTRFQGRYKDT